MTDANETKVVENEQNDAELAGASRSAAERLGQDLVPLDLELRKHGASIGALLRTVARTMHGIHLPLLETTEKGSE